MKRPVSRVCVYSEGPASRPQEADPGEDSGTKLPGGEPGGLGWRRAETLGGMDLGIHQT